MLYVEIDNVHNIIVEADKVTTKIDFIDSKGGTTRVELTKADAGLLLEELQYQFSKV